MPWQVSRLLCLFHAGARCYHANSWRIQNVFSWSASILAHTKLGRSEQAVELYFKGQNTGVEPDGHVFVAALKACTSASTISHGRIIHSHVLEGGIDPNIYVANTLIDMYVKCGSLKEAHTLFNIMPKRDLVTWNAIIAGYVQLGHQVVFYHFLQGMHMESIEPDNVTFVCILKACSNVPHLNQGRLIHRQICECGLELNVYVGSTLIDMYAKCRNLEDARSVFDGLTKRNLVTWNTLVAGYAQNGDGQEAIRVFEQMQHLGIVPSQATLVCILKSCSSIAALDQGKQIHAHVVELGYESEEFVGSTLIDMYAKFGSLEEAHNVFNTSKQPDTVTWSALIAGYAGNGHSEEVIKLFQQLQQEGTEPNQIIFVCIIKACSSMKALKQGKLIHVHIIEKGLGSEIYVGNTLVDMYAKCGDLEEAQHVFDEMQKQDVVTWNALLAGYSQHCRCMEAFWLFQCMLREGMEPDNVTLVCLLNVCSSSVALDKGKLIHCLLNETSFGSDVFVGNALIDMYAKCGSLDDALKVFNEILKRDVVSWSAMIAGFVDHGCTDEALVLFHRMQRASIRPNQGLIVSTLKACTDGLALDQGKLIHACICYNTSELDIIVGNTLIDMYAKCGSVEDACRVFHEMQGRDQVTWSIMIAGFAHHNKYEFVWQCFEGMQREQLKPNDVTLICLLSACSHAGLVAEGCFHFCSMVDEYGMTPVLDHYNCVVDLFGKAKQLNEAEDLLLSMPFHSNVVGWTSLLCHCKAHGNVKLGRRCFDQVVAMDCSNASVHVLMADIYGDAGMHEEANKLEEFMKSADVWKKPGKAFTEIGGYVHNFIVGDRSHPQTRDIYGKLKSLRLQMKELGLIPHCGVSAAIDSP